MQKFLIKVEIPSKTRNQRRKFLTEVDIPPENVKLNAEIPSKPDTRD
jgi:hypothetical protein